MWQPNNNRAVNLVHNKELIWNNFYSNDSALVFIKLEHIVEALLLQNGIGITLLLINGGKTCGGRNYYVVHVNSGRSDPPIHRCMIKK